MSLNVTILLSRHRSKIEKLDVKGSSVSSMALTALFENPKCIASSVASNGLYNNERRRKCMSDGVAFRNSSLVTVSEILHIFLNTKK